LQMLTDTKTHLQKNNRLSPVFKIPLQHERRIVNSGRILLFEGDVLLLNERSRLLSKEGFVVSEIASLETALQNAQQDTFDLLIFSIDNPNVLNRILTRLPLRRNALFLTDRNIAEEVIEDVNGELHNCLFSPFNSTQLIDAVVNSLRRSRQLKEMIRNEVLSDLNSLIHDLNMGTEISKFMDTVTQLSSVTTSADYVSTIVYGKESGESLIKSEVGEFDPLWNRMLKKLINHEESIILDDDSPYKNVSVKLMNEVGITSMLYVPISSKESILGCIVQFNKEGGDKFSEADLKFVSILAWLSGMIIENNKVYLDYFREHVHADRLLDHISFAQENERKRVAVDIHDGVAQWLVGASYDIKLCSRLIAESNYPEVELTLEKVTNILQNSIKELRRAISNLPLPPLEEIGLVEVIHRLAEKVKEEGIECDLNIPENLPYITLAQQKTSYWFILESLTNVRKHARATHVTINIEHLKNTISINIMDNGIGFDLEQVMKSKVSMEHIGLLGMTERADYLNGNFKINSTLGKGTAVNLSFSLNPTGKTITSEGLNE
jgi:signal transduction histidine kinase/DNA-binding response OmpR family regulator